MLTVRLSKSCCKLQSWSPSCNVNRLQALHGTVKVRVGRNLISGSALPP